MGEFYKSKALFLIFMFLAAIFLGFGWIGATESVKAVLVFYILFLFMPTIWIVFIDLFTAGKFEEINTITLDDPEDSVANDALGITISPMQQFTVGLIIAGLLGFRIITSGFGIVGVPQFQIFEGTVGNALLSATVGLTEDWMFFGVVFPIILGFMKKYFDNLLLAFIISMLIASGVFMGYHSWRYGFNQVALFSTFTFALISISFAGLTNSLIISNILHITNNLLVTLAFAKNIAFAIAI